MIIYCLIITSIAVALLCYIFYLKMQIRQWSKDLDAVTGDSNLRLTTGLHEKNIVDFCKVLNEKLDEQQNIVITQKNMSRELKETIAALSHDIRTPLTSVNGYMQLLVQEDNPEKIANYTQVIWQKLNDLEVLLDEMFLYTKLVDGDYEIKMEQVVLYDKLSYVLAAFYEPITNAGMSVTVAFDKENISVNANAEYVERIFTNLIKNAIVHGTGEINICQKDYMITIANQVKNSKNLDVTRLFERFYKGEKSRGSGSTGLGLSIVKSLMEKMGGNVQANLEQGYLEIVLQFETS